MPTQPPVQTTQPPACSAATYPGHSAVAFNRLGLAGDVNELRVISENPGSLYGKYYGYWGASGSALTFGSVSGGGTCRLMFRYRTNGSVSRSVAVNGQQVGTLNFGPTGSFEQNAWSIAWITVPVPAGASVRLTYTGPDGAGYLDLDQLDVAPS